MISFLWYDWSSFPMTDHKGVSGLHGGRVPSSATEGQRRHAVVVAYHGSSAGEHDPSLGGHGQATLPGWGKDCQWLTLKVPGKLQLYGLYVYYVVHICDLGMLRVKYWACSQRSESRSESRFGSRSASWLGSWFELRVFTCIATAVPFTNRICALQYFVPTAQIDPCMASSARTSKNFENAQERITFRKSFAFTCPQNQAFKVDHFKRFDHVIGKRYISTCYVCMYHNPKLNFFRVSIAWFERALRSQRVKSGFHIVKESESPSEAACGTWFALFLTGSLFWCLHIIGHWQI